MDPATNADGLLKINADTRGGGEGEVPYVTCVTTALA